LLISEGMATKLDAAKVLKVTKGVLKIMEECRSDENRSIDANLPKPSRKRPQLKPKEILELASSLSKQVSSSHKKEPDKASFCPVEKFAQSIVTRRDLPSFDDEPSVKDEELKRLRQIENVRKGLSEQRQPQQLRPMPQPLSQPQPQPQPRPQRRSQPQPQPQPQPRPYVAGSHSGVVTSSAAPRRLGIGPGQNVIRAVSPNSVLSATSQKAQKAVLYVVTTNSLPVKISADRNSGTVGTVRNRQEIMVAEVGPTIDGRVRARILEPPGWISLRFADGTAEYAKPVEANGKASPVSASRGASLSVAAAPVSARPLNGSMLSVSSPREHSRSSSQSQALTISSTRKPFGSGMSSPMLVSPQASTATGRSPSTATSEMHTLPQRQPSYVMVNGGHGAWPASGGSVSFSTASDPKRAPATVVNLGSAGPSLVPAINGSAAYRQSSSPAVSMTRQMSPVAFPLGAGSGAYPVMRIAGMSGGP